MPDPQQHVGGDRYALGRVIGDGSQGTTFEAVDKRDGKLVAIKRFQIKGAESWKSVELAQREAEVLATLDHELLPAHLGHFDEGGCLYLVMEKLEGTPLSEWRRSQAFGVGQCLRFLADAAIILDYLHNRPVPVIHRDIKPSNVFLRADGRPAEVIPVDVVLGRRAAEYFQFQVAGIWAYSLTLGFLPPHP